MNINLSKKLDTLNKLLFKEITKFTKDNNLIVHKITIEERSIVFEVLSMDEKEGQPQFKTSQYAYINNGKN